MITLTKPSDSTPTTTTEQGPKIMAPRRPWYPLVGHRKGLYANDLVTLASALWVLALEGGTAHLGHDLYEARCSATTGQQGPCYCPAH